jgi:predicted enzyme related to lactoylglutathione lyase
MESKKSEILRGLATVSFFAADHEKAVKWYSDFLKIEPYYNMPGYSEFRIGDYQHELGIIDSKFAPENISIKPAGAIVFWHVDNLQITLDKLLSMGAKEFSPMADRSEGFITASVVDPFGNNENCITENGN